MARWAKAAIARDQITLFSPTLDAMIAPDHPVRLFEEILAARDWSGWEAHYVLAEGQPPIHPRILAGVVLYGLSQGLRSSRRLEWACGNALDYLWLAEGRQIDHSTICKFRTQFGAQLKDLFRQLGRLAMSLGMVRLNQVSLDATKVQANSSRHATATAVTLEARLAALDQQIERMFAEAQQADQNEQELFGTSVSPNHLPRDLADCQRRQQRLKQALVAAQRKARDARTREPKKTPVPQGPEAATASVPAPRAPAVPVADPQSTILPNKAGGFAPNYTPVLCCDGKLGLIVDAAVLPGQEQPDALIASLDRVQQDLGQLPQQVLADSAYGSGENLQALQERGIEGLIPLRERGETAPAMRPDPRVPLSKEQLAALPQDGGTKKWDRAAFVFDAENDCYFCPLGQVLEYVGLNDKGGGRMYRKYTCRHCAECRHRDRCVPGRGTDACRSVYRDAHEPLREQMMQRLSSIQGQAVYRRRSAVVETPFAWLKQQMGLRQFLMRGLEKVEIEWRWGCCAYNLTRMVRHLQQLRAQFAVLAA
jgi:transposase